MKNKLLLSMAALVLLASCSTKIGLVKRKYNKGFYVSVTKKHPDAAHPVEAKVVKTSVAKVHAAKKESAPAQVITNNENKITSTENQNVVANNQQGKNTAVVAKVETKNAALENKSAKSEPQLLASAKKTETPAKFSKIKTLSNQLLNSKKAGGSDTQKILWVLLCLLWFFGLIAVYLHDGGIKLNFWIALLLYLTYLGGVIFSILVVLDIINLN